VTIRASNKLHTSITETGELQEQRLPHREEAERFYRDLAAREARVRVGMEASEGLRGDPRGQRCVLHGEIVCLDSEGKPTVPATCYSDERSLFLRLRSALG
jgi:hypothetical protein